MSFSAVKSTTFSPHTSPTASLYYNRANHAQHTSAIGRKSAVPGNRKALMTAVKVTSDPRDGTAGRIHTEHRGGVGDIPAMQDSGNLPARDYKPGQEADRAGFEPAVTCATTVFKTVSFDRSDTCPYVSHRTARKVGPVTKTRVTVYNTLGPATPARTRPARPGREECGRGRPGLSSPDPGARWGLRPPT